MSSHKTSMAWVLLGILLENGELQGSSPQSELDMLHPTHQCSVHSKEQCEDRKHTIGTSHPKRGFNADAKKLAYGHPRLRAAIALAIWEGEGDVKGLPTRGSHAKSLNDWTILIDHREYVFTFLMFVLVTYDEYVGHTNYSHESPAGTTTTWNTSFPCSANAGILRRVILACHHKETKQTWTPATWLTFLTARNPPPRCQEGWSLRRSRLAHHQSLPGKRREFLPMCQWSGQNSKTTHATHVGMFLQFSMTFDDRFLTRQLNPAAILLCHRTPIRFKAFQNAPKWMSQCLSQRHHGS